MCPFGHAHVASDTTFESCLDVFGKMKEYRDRTWQAGRLAANYGMLIGHHYQLTYQEDWPNQWPPKYVGGAWVAEFTGETDTHYELKAGAGIGSFLVGFLLAVGGGYLVTNQVQVESGPFGGFAWFGPNSFGLLMIPLLIGVALLCFDSKLLAGRLLTAAGAVILLASVLNTLRITFLPTSLFLVLLMLGLLVSGFGLMARSLLGSQSQDERHQDRRFDLREEHATPRSETLTSAAVPSLPSAPEQNAVPASPISVDEELTKMRAKKRRPN